MKQKRFNSFLEITFASAVLATVLLALPGTSYATPPLEISTCTTINTSGSYRLVADLRFAPGTADLPNSSTCITISASNVDLKLNGHTITGPAAADGTAGISVTGQTNVDIRGAGVISKFGRGIEFIGVTFSQVRGASVDGNFFGFVVLQDSNDNLFRGNTSNGNVSTGFTLNGASNNSLINNTANDNGTFGILLFAGLGNQVKGNTTNGNALEGILAGGGTGVGHTIKDNTASNNGLFGIRVPFGSTGNTVTSNTAQSNHFIDLADDNDACDNNTWAHNVFNTSSQTCIQ